MTKCQTSQPSPKERLMLRAFNKSAWDQVAFTRP